METGKSKQRFKLSYLFFCFSVVVTLILVDEWAYLKYEGQLKEITSSGVTLQTNGETKKFYFPTEENEDFIVYLKDLDNEVPKEILFELSDFSDFNYEPPLVHLGTEIVKEKVDISKEIGYVPNKTTIKVSPFSKKIIKVNTTYHFKDISKQSEKRKKENFIFFEVKQAEYNSNVKPPFELSVTLHIPKKLEKENLIVVLDEDLRRKLSYRYTEYSFSLYKKIDGNRYQRLDDDFIVDKKYLEKYEHIFYPENPSFVIRKETEKDLFNLKNTFKKFSYDIKNMN